MRDGQDWRDWGGALAQPPEAAQALLKLERTSEGVVEAEVVPAAGVTAWAAYWTVTEHGHHSKVRAGENSGEFLRHDFVVRQYVPVGRHQGAQRLKLHTIAPNPAHARQINLVVYEPRSLRPLQALSLACAG